MVSILGKNIKDLRTEKNMSIRDLSSKSNVGSSTISQIETGKRQSLQSETLQKIANALEVTTNDLLNIQEGSYEVTELEEAIEFILSDDELQIDGIDMSDIERNQFRFAVEMAINTIKSNRK